MSYEVVVWVWDEILFRWLPITQDSANACFSKSSWACGIYTLQQSEKKAIPTIMIHDVELLDEERMVSSTMKASCKVYSEATF